MPGSLTRSFMGWRSKDGLWVPGPGSLPTSPIGDVASEGFEGSGSGGYELTFPCGSAPCWNETGAVDQAFALSGLSGGTGTSQNGSYGARVNAITTALYMTLTHAAQANHYLEFSFYVDSESFGTWCAIKIGSVGTNADSSDALYNIYFDRDGAAADFRIYARGSTYSSSGTITTDTWYYVKCFAADASASSYIKVGTTYGGMDILDATFTAYDVAANPAKVSLGSISTGGNYTVDITFGYVAVDDDGTF